MQNNWTNLVYGIYDFLFWEPQHIGKITNPTNYRNKNATCMKHVKNMEVSLNQILDIFFVMISSEIQKDLFFMMLGKDNSEYKNYQIYLDGDGNIYGAYGITQPDICFFGETENVFIELKTNSKTDIYQIIKYIIIHIKDEEKLGYKKKFNLVLLGSGSFKSNIKENIDSIEDLYNAIDTYDIPNKTKKGGMDLILYKEQIKSCFKNMNFKYISYSDFIDYLKKIREKYDDNKTEYIINGLITEIQTRGLK